MKPNFSQFKISDPPKSLEEVIERLEKTAAVLELLEDKEFNYSSYVAEGDVISNCGTVCCLAGWYPKFIPESGLVWENYLITISTGKRVAILGLNSALVPDDPYHYYRSDKIDERLCRYHGLTLEAIRYIFYGFNLRLLPKRPEIYIATRLQLAADLAKFIELVKTSEEFRKTFLIIPFSVPINE